MPRPVPHRDPWFYVFVFIVVVMTLRLSGVIA